MRVDTRDGLTLHADVCGNGPGVVLSCGLATTHRNWSPQAEAWSRAGFRVATWDYRGHGLSDAPEDAEAYSHARVLEDLCAVLDATLGPEPAVVGGLSFGGLLSLHLALKAPERVRALLLADTGPGFKKPEAQAAWERRTGRTADFYEEHGFEEVARRAPESLVGLHPERPAARAALEVAAAQQAHGVANFARRVSGPVAPVLDRLGEIQVPALILVGEKDDAFLRAADVLAARLPRAERVTLAGAGHISNLDAPEDFDAAVLGFLAGLA